MIDRLYYIYAYEDDEHYSYEIYLRMLVDGIHPYYAKLEASEEGHGFDCEFCGRGIIRFTKSPFFF